jgi:adenosylmethionine-8-amino-7-oxononanoate aminotransferase
MLEVEGCVIFGVSESESVIAYDDASEKIVLHIRHGYHGVGGCGACVCGGLHQLS